MEWWQSGIRHRYNDQPAIIDENGGMIWYENGNAYTHK
jgi:hypothetical protein